MSRTGRVPLEVGQIPPLTRGEARSLASTEFQRTLDLLRAVEPEDLDRPTDCDRWDVRRLGLHLLGTTEGQASPREALHQFRRGIPLTSQIGGVHWVDGINELQIRERQQLTWQEVLARFEQAAPRAVRSRFLTPPPLRWLPLHLPPPIGWKPATYLLVVLFTRDVWMHRIDLARAIGADLETTADHDGRLVADIVWEWARRHGEPVTLDLHGPAGGCFTQGVQGQHLQLDAVEFCRLLSGRGHPTGILARHPLPL